MILQRYILRELLVNFIVAWAIVIAVFAIGLIFQTVRDTTGGLADVLLRTSVIALAYATPWAIIIASATAATLTYGRLAADNEIDAIRTSGIHLNRVVMPGLLFGFILTGAAFVIHQEILPRALFARRNLVNELALSVLQRPPQGKQTFRLGGEVMLAYLDAKDGRFINPVVTLYTKDGQMQLQGREARAVIDPESRTVSIILVDGQITVHSNGKMTVVGTFRGEYEKPLPLEPPMTVPEAPGDMTREQLELLIAPGHRGHTQFGANTEYWSRYGRSFAPLALILLAIPVGLMVRKGSRLAGLGMALPSLLGYIVLMLLFEGFGRRGRLAPEIASFAPSSIMLVIAFGALFRVYRR